MKMIIMMIVFILGISLITACATKKMTEDPTISLEFYVSDLTEDEYKLVGTKSLEDPKKEDFKNIEFKLDVEQSNKISNRNITSPNIKEIVKSQYEDRYWYEKSYYQDNESDNYAEYSEK